MFPDLSHLRGMSEPFFFSFNILPDPQKTMLCHAVIFSSFTVSHESVCKICALDDDPRMRRFVEFVIENYGQKAKDALRATIQERAQQLDQLERQIATLKKQLQQLKQKAS